MMVLKVVLIFALVLINSQSEAYKMTRCELVKQLRHYGFVEDALQNWVCLVESESDRRTDVIGKVNKNGSRDYGLFQINDNFWCSNTTQPGKGCYVTCVDLITDDIKKATDCTKIIYKRQGFRAWHGWTKRCQNQTDLPDISTCTLLEKNSIEAILKLR